MIIEALLTAGIAFWIIMAVVTILLFILIENDCGGWATVTLLVTFAALQYLTNLNPWGYIKENPFLALPAFGVYLLIGMFWAIAKWWFYVKAELRKYNEFRAEWVKTNGEPTTNELKHDLMSAAKSRYGEYNIDICPQVTSHKEQVYLWLCYWPWSCISTVLNDPVRRLFLWAYQKIRRTLQKISDDVWAGVSSDMPTATKKERSGD